MDHYLTRRDRIWFLLCRQDQGFVGDTGSQVPQEYFYSKSYKLSLPRRRRPAAPPGTFAAEEKQMPQYLSILQRSDCRKAGATGGNQMKTITIRLPDVEAAMLLEVQKVNRAYRDLQGLLMSQIREEYGRACAKR